MIAIVALLTIPMFEAASTLAASTASHLTIHALAMPTHFSSSDTALCLKEPVASPGEAPCDTYLVTVTNSGDAPAKGPITLVDVLPAGLQVLAVTFSWWQDRVTTEVGSTEGNPDGEQLYPNPQHKALCTQEATSASCEFPTQIEGRAVQLQPDQRLNMEIATTVQPGAVNAPNTASVSEAGGPVASSVQNDVISATPPPFGPSAFTSAITSPDGSSDVQAGDHPYEFATTIDVNSKMGFTPGSQFLPTTVGDGVRDVVVDLPLGFLDSAQATAKCTWAQLQSASGGCPLDTLVGTITTQPVDQTSVVAAIFNMVPERGVAAEFGFRDSISTTHAITAGIVPTSSGYVLRATARELPDVRLTSITETFYGDPAGKTGSGTPGAQLTNTSGCSGQPVKSTLYMDDWEHPGTFNADGTPNLSDPNWTQAVSESPPLSGCRELRFSPDAFSVKPGTTVADSPTGLSLDLKIPQSEAPGTLATPPLQNARLELPEGMTINPSGVSGLAACSEAQIGWLGGSLTNFTAGAPACPEASKIGSVDMATPLFVRALTGAIYLASQDENPFRSTLAIYVVVDDPETGVLIKFPGELSPDPRTGRLTVVFGDLPQLPLSELNLRFFEGPRAKLTTPESCGTFTTTSDLMPWSAPWSGPDATPSDSFTIASGCISGFAPSFQAGVTSVHAGGYSPLLLSFTRSDSDQELAGLSTTLPPGLLASVAHVPLCSDAQLTQAQAGPGGCPEASRVGLVTVGAGPGPQPLYVNGKAYLTGPYNGGPYGLALVIPVTSGPFNFGTIVVRASLRIDPHTAQVTLVTDRFPTILDVLGANGIKSGIPLRMRSVYVDVDREAFIVDPTGCTPSRVSGTLASAAGTSAPVSSRFQVANCAKLPFKPSVTALTRANGQFGGHGASLHVVITTAQGQANMRSLKLDLPQRLPARLETIQKACPQHTFDVNAAACPRVSVIGVAAARTPMLANTLEGPVILVSHGGTAFPDLVLVLQARGVRIDLTGELYVDQKNITSATFRALPDVPIRRLDLVLPEGRFSALAASASLCTKKPLRMTTEITGQNGARLKPTIKVAVAGCSHTRPRQRHSNAKRRTRPGKQGTRRPGKQGTRTSAFFFALPAVLTAFHSP